jgi:hypothetical protein
MESNSPVVATFSDLQEELKTLGKPRFSAERGSMWALAFPFPCYFSWYG